MASSNASGGLLQPLDSLEYIARCRRAGTATVPPLERFTSQVPPATLTDPSTAEIEAAVHTAHRRLIS